MMWFLGIASFVYGAVVGSFLNVVILRLPEEQSLTGRSHCPNCGHVLGAMELVPLVSFLALGRKCKKCRTSISWRYFLIELITGVLFVLTWMLQQPGDVSEYLVFVRTLIIISTLVVVFVIDLEHYLILDKVLLVSGALVVLLGGIVDWLQGTGFLSTSSFTGGGLIAACLATLPLFLLWLYSKGRWMGFGDVKFMLFLGFAVGWPLILVNWLGAFWLGALYSLAVLALKKKTLHSKLPFGVFLSLATLLTLYWGRSLFDWYMAFLGF
jgi:leader peptidase (prepilin peptidase) / N-methyltransferase